MDCIYQSFLFIEFLKCVASRHRTVGKNFNLAEEKSYLPNYCLDLLEVYGAIIEEDLSFKCNQF